MLALSAAALYAFADCTPLLEVFLSMVTLHDCDLVTSRAAGSFQRASIILDNLFHNPVVVLP